MPAFDPVLWRTASLVRQQLLRRRTACAELYLPQAVWANLQKLVRQLQLAQARGWERAIPVLRSRLAWQIQQLHNQLDRVEDELRQQQHRVSLPTVSELIAELRGLAAELDEFQCRPRRGLLLATTHSIVLNDIRLGRFQIELDLKALSSSQCYRIIALDPNPADGNPSVTHPHVQNQQLCEGDGHQPIQAALADGRLMDFFLIVQRLLSSYGEGKAYVELRDWQGEPCQQCGARTGSDGCDCHRCDDRLCDDCSGWCAACSLCYCNQCIDACAGCQESFCRECLQSCDGCEQLQCVACLADGRCKACQSTSPQPDSLQESL